MAVRQLKSGVPVDYRGTVDHPRVASDRLIVALDSADLPSALAMARRLKGIVRMVKIGSVLFTACGPVAIRKIKQLGFDVMLDLKFFDIPSTIEMSCRAAARHRVSLLTVHATGQRPMLEAAVRGATEEAWRLGLPVPDVLAVTVLTSVGENNRRSISAQVLRLAEQARQAHCPGVVASAQEAAKLRKRFGQQLRILCPGIRASSAGGDDQHRVATPSQALLAGADWLVVGRPITASVDPRQATKRILKEMEAATEC